MNGLAEVLILLIVLCGVLKASFWPAWLRWVYGALLAAFVCWSNGYAMAQSKTQIDGWLADTALMQSVAVVVTIDAALSLAFCLALLSSDDNHFPATRWQKALLIYPNMLMFPALFYVLTQLLFSQVGYEFSTIAMLLAATVLVAMPLSATMARRWMPVKEGRAEALLIMSVMATVIGLMMTQTHAMVYHVAPRHVDVKMLAVCLGLFVSFVALGYFAEIMKNKKRNKKKPWT